MAISTLDRATSGTTTAQASCTVCRGRGYVRSSVGVAYDEPAEKLPCDCTGRAKLGRSMTAAEAARWLPANTPVDAPVGGAR